MSNNSKEYMKKNYKKYWGSADAIKERSERNKARRKKWLKVGDPREVDHIKWVKAWNGKKNLRIISQKKNRQLGANKANRKKTKWATLHYV
jgi:hypothetical protein